MLIYFGPFVLLLFHTVLAESDCGPTLSNKSVLIVYSKQYDTTDQHACDLYIIAKTKVYIELNFTDLRGFEVPWQPANSSTVSMECLPKISITERNTSGEEFRMGIICPVQKLLKDPPVFPSHANNLTLIYKWDPKQRTGHTLYLDFQLKVNVCTFYCDGSTCQSDQSLVCNGRSHCRDQSDAQLCNEQHPSSAPTEQLVRSTSTIMPLVVVIIIVVCILGVVLLGICHCRTAPWLCRGDSSHTKTSEHENLHPNSQMTCSEDYSGIPTQEQRAIASYKEKQTRLKSIRTDNELGLPPSIPISEDGEEGFLTSQRLLQSCDRSHKIDCQAFCPPPNITIYNGESPSSFYHSHSTTNSSFLALSVNKKIPLPSMKTLRESNGHSNLNHYSYLEGHSHPSRSKPHTKNPSSSTLQPKLSSDSQNPQGQKFDRLGNYSLVSSPSTRMPNEANVYSFQPDRHL
ncbi:low-density lipoprotein receptor class A domain-containing protein 4 isoform X2 [Octopus sinensis]|uniref:Low-density lipoprotein receptor class A domain-containing protein 4 isoform X1 n=1 Tax=Octopus sinensis TaxID=2607531 RepID=A0A6P7S6K8_9MOLL|nr:low-density lipoprotein receptor class A domain-containing protein 4 isoform X1 [Octopus sinensis]XP_029633776.1 low-density lipoprotein receptor class A domain-containing protein 4 isoform X2 [Octopus sinensis]